METSVQTSLPSRERGLKFCVEKWYGQNMKSLPSRERGLKFTVVTVYIRRLAVAPFAGAWIEIDWWHDKNSYRLGRSLRGSVD